MCTALTMTTGGHYFGRTLDLEYHYSESVTVMPRRFPVRIRQLSDIEEHYAVIGMATVADGYPLYYDGMNEHGLGMAGLNFPGYAFYPPADTGRKNVAPFELIPWVLGQCADVVEARRLLEDINIAGIDFSPELPVTPMHWMIADGKDCICVEPLEAGLKIWDDPAGVLTNSPPFDMQMVNLSNYSQLSAFPPENRLAPELNPAAYSRGMGALGLPGDLSSSSRFVRAVFARFNSVCREGEEESVGQFFHILDSVSQTRGCVRLESGEVTTVYSSCSSAVSGIYYYTTYDNRRINSVDIHREDLDGTSLVCYPPESGQDIVLRN